MTLTTPKRSSNSPSSVIQRDDRKRLGQFFTGPRLASLLAELASASSAKNICDPMAGRGDMLLACVAAGADPLQLDGVEIDTPAFQQCVANVEGLAHEGRASIVLGDAFSANTWKNLRSGYDLVITNPPYVRYQSMADRHPDLPDAGRVRDGLCDAINEMKHLDSEDKIALIALAKAYSGHSDLLLPSWLLAVSILRPGGTLAMVLPESFLSRNYTAMAWYSLLRWFDLDFVIQDVDSCWFEDAQVKTALLVARRVEHRPSPLQPAADAGHLVVRLRRTSVDERSIVGRLYSSHPAPNKAFAADAHRLLESRGEPSDQRFDTHWEPAQHMADMVANLGHRSHWLAMPHRLTLKDAGRGAPVPSRLLSLVEQTSDGEAPAFASLEDYGWGVSQGLRTGANGFFYLDSIEDRNQSQLVRTSGLFDERVIEVPNRFLVPVLRRQSELPVGRRVDAGMLDGRVLVIEDAALTEDIAEALRWAGSSAPSVLNRLRPLPDGLQSYVLEAAAKEARCGDSSRLIRERSAVATNVRKWSSTRPDSAPRYWYTLPSLRDRHRPALIVPRVQGFYGGAYLSEGREFVVDANFSTLWPTKTAALDVHTTLAILSSSWVSLYLELTASVMGGGALKVEATHLRRVMIPLVPEPARQRLHDLGLALAAACTAQECLAVIAGIDSELAQLIAPPRSAVHLDSAIQQLLQNRRDERSGRTPHSM